MKNKVIIVLAVIWILSLFATYFSIRYAQDQKAKRVTAENNLYANETQYMTESGKIASRVNELQSTVKQLKAASRKDSLLRSDYENKLAHANSVIKDLNIRLRNVESSHNVGIESSRIDTVYYAIDSIQQLKISDIRTPYFEAVFKPVKDSLIVVSHRYQSNVDIIIARDRGARLDGNKRFILCRLISPKWKYSATVLAEDPDAKIVSNDYVRFKKR